MFYHNKRASETIIDKKEVGGCETQSCRSNLALALVFAHSFSFLGMTLHVTPFMVLHACNILRILVIVLEYVLLPLICVITLCVSVFTSMFSHPWSLASLIPYKTLYASRDSTSSPLVCLFIPPTTLPSQFLATIPIPPTFVHGHHDASQFSLIAA